MSSKVLQAGIWLVIGATAGWFGGGRIFSWQGSDSWMAAFFVIPGILGALLGGWLGATSETSVRWPLFGAVIIAPISAVVGAGFALLVPWFVAFAMISRSVGGTNR